MDETKSTNEGAAEETDKTADKDLADEEPVKTIDEDLVKAKDLVKAEEGGKTDSLDLAPTEIIAINGWLRCHLNTPNSPNRFRSLDQNKEAKMVKSLKKILPHSCKTNTAWLNGKTEPILC